MKKLALLVILAFVLIFAVGYTLPGEYRVARTVLVNQPPATVFQQVADLRNLQKWHPMSDAEPSARHEFSGNAGAVGASWTWEGQMIGQGSLSITSVDPDKHVQLAFTAPGSAGVVDDWRFEETSDGTRVTWSTSGQLDYPVGRFIGLLLDSWRIGPQLEMGLDKLKTSLR